MKRKIGTAWAWARGHVPGIALALALLALFIELGCALDLQLRFPIVGGKAEARESHVLPAEFLYLDEGRVIAYLAQYQGGMIKSESQSRKLIKKLQGDVKVGGLLGAGGSSEEEDATQRVVTPTGASSYMTLLDTLAGEGQLKRVGHCYSCLGDLAEGQFVMLKTNAMRPPTYLNSYLAVKQNTTLSALFPIPKGNPVARQWVSFQREAAIKFAEQVGDNPRIIFALRRDGWEEAAPQYLLPVQYQLLTKERSLIKYGGGAFTLVGKVVRIFPSAGGGSGLSYVDSPTRETWQSPLHQALGALLCRSNPACLSELRRERESQEERQLTIERMRKNAEESLLTQTQIRRQGAVIIPLAIYK